jgi:flagellar basal-body rod modification protein FlgD
MSTAVTNSTSTANSAATTNTSSSSANPLQSISVNDFTKMLVTELQNQDPTQPMSNTDLMNQVSQIQAIESNQQLTTTLQSVALGQSVASAGNLIGRTVSGLDSNGNKVSGTVSSASISNGSAVLNVGNSSIPLSNITQISTAGSSAGS